MNMKLLVNGEDVTLPEGTTVRSLLDTLDLGSGPVAVERNGEVVPRALHPTTPLAEGDKVEVVHFVGGG